MKFYKKNLLIFAAVTTCLAVPAFVMGAGKPALPVIPNAVGIYVSPRGQDYLGNHLDKVLDANGLNFEEYSLPSYEYKAEKPLTLDDLPPQLRGHRKALLELQAYIKRFTTGFNLRPPQFEVTVLGARYKLDFRMLGIRVLPDGNRKYGVKSGLVLQAVAVIPDLRIDIDKIRVRDQNNRKIEFLQKKLGMLDFTAQLRTPDEKTRNRFGDDEAKLIQAGLKSRPLKIEIPMHFQIIDGKIQVKALKLNTSLGAVTLDAKPRQMILPDFKFGEGNDIRTMNKAEIQEYLFSEKTGLMKALQGYLKQYTEENAVPLLNDNLKAAFANGWSETIPIDPPGGVRLSPNEFYNWTLTPESAKLLSDGKLFMGLSSTISDPLAPEGTPLVLTGGSNTATLKDYPADAYDMALVLNQDVVNRMLAFSYKRGYFEKVKTDDGSFIKLLRAPVFRFDQGRASLNALDGNGRSTRINQASRNHGKLRISAEQHVPRGYQRIGVKGAIRLEFDLYVHLVPSGDTVKLVVNRIDLDSVVIDESSLTAAARNFGPLKSTVIKTVRETLKAANDSYSRSLEVLGAMPVPSVGGIPVLVKDAKTDPKGSIVLYLEYNLK